MSEITQDNLNEIEQKLTNIEQKIGNKWAMPIVVALISGLIGVVTVAVQVNLEASSANAAKEWEVKRAAMDAERKKGEEFYHLAHSMTWDVRKQFRERCRLVSSNGVDLDDLLEKFHFFTDENRPMYDEDIIGSLQSYGDWVAESTYDPEKLNCGPEGEAKFQEVNRALLSFFKQRCTGGEREQQKEISWFTQFLRNGEDDGDRLASGFRRE